MTESGLLTASNRESRWNIVRAPVKTPSRAQWRRPEPYDGRGGIWTTLDALNAALGLGAANDDNKLLPDQVF